MRFSIWPIVAILLYAVGNVVLDRKLRELPPLSIVLFYGVTLAVLSGGFGLAARQHLSMPSSVQWPFLILVAVCWFFADNSYFRAYQSGASMAFITTCLACMPAVSSLLSVCLGGKAPTWRHWVAWALILCALLLVSSGEHSSSPSPTPSRSPLQSDIL